MSEIVLSTIGHVRSPATLAIDEDWGNVVSEIVLDAEFAPGIKGLEAFSHLLILFHMHEAAYREANLVRHPMDRAELPEVGIFAQRARVRPNQIGVTAVELIEVTDNTLRVRGLDAIDGTPVLDIKPYVTQFDFREKTKQPKWIDDILKDYF